MSGGTSPREPRQAHEEPADFILLGLLFAVPGEMLNQIPARQDVGAFRSTAISYTVLLAIGIFVGKGHQYGLSEAKGAADPLSPVREPRSDG